MSAFLAVLLALIVAFLAEYGCSPHRGQLPISVSNVEAPHSSALNVINDDRILITVTRDGHVFFGRDLTNSENLAYLIHNAVSRGAQTRIYLNVDKRAQYSSVAAVIDQIHESGVQDITFLTSSQPNR